MRTELATCHTDKYMSVRFLAECSRLFGERGRVLMGVYDYLRWVDDVADEGELLQQDKITFLDRQSKIVARGEVEDLTHDENKYRNLPWGILDEESRDVVNRSVETLIETMRDDVRHQGSFVRNKEEMHKYRVSSLDSCLTMVGILFNGRGLGASQRFTNLLSAWSNLGYLLDFGEDISRHMFQIGFTLKEVDEINDQATSEERRALALRIFDRNRFYRERNKSVGTSEALKWQFLNCDMPVWQQLGCILYSLRVFSKSMTEIKYPETDVIGNYLRSGLVAKTRRLIGENRSGNLL